jgi:hypothetical protein
VGGQKAFMIVKEIIVLYNLTPHSAERSDASAVGGRNPHSAVGGRYPHFTSAC